MGAIAFAAYALTASPAVGWWDDSHYSLAAVTLSLTNPPGSLLLTLVGWLASRVVVAPTLALQLHLVSALIGAATAALLARLTMDLATPADRKPGAGEVVAGALAGLLYAGSFHVWSYATEFTPYTLSAGFTVLILVALVRALRGSGEPDGIRRWFVVLLLLGLDVSVHRTNLLLAPALLLAIVLLPPVREWRVAAVGIPAAGFAAGLAAQLGVIVLSRRQPFLDLWEPNTLPRLWSYVALEGLGGGFLVNVWPRRAAFFSVQLSDWTSFLGSSLGTSPWTAGVALGLALLGAWALLRRDRRLAIALIACALALGVGAVLYFNRPLQYFRPLQRHYLGSWAALAPLVGIGLASLWNVGAGRHQIVARAAATIAALVAIAGVIPNAVRCDRSHTRYAERFARDLLEPLPANAILLTNGDNDSFPLWYLQQAARVRTDVSVLNVNVLRAPSFIRRLRRTDPTLAALPDTGLVAPVLVKGARPVYAAVTVVFEELPDSLVARRLEGLAYRLTPAPDSSEWDIAPLDRFVTERLAGAGLDDRRQRLESEMGPMLMNYTSATLQLAGERIRRGEPEAALDLLDRLDRAVDESRLGAQREAYETMTKGMREWAESARTSAQARTP